jgi:putative ABC transport system substrate-binding protein
MDRQPAAALKLVQLKMDIIVTSGTQGARVAKQATSTIPIVMAVSGYPDKLGLVESLSHPGGNVTGQRPASKLPALASPKSEFVN